VKEKLSPVQPKKGRMHNALDCGTINSFYDASAHLPRLNCSPKDIISTNVASFANRVVADVIKLR
jgi:hypothetical protein